MLSSYTTPSEVRAALGVSTTELPDTVVNLPIYDTLAVLSMEDANSNIPSKYLALKAQVSPALTTAEQRFVDIVHLFVTYSTAKEMLVSLSLFAVQALTDGKAGFDRQTDVYQDVREGVNNMLASLRIRLINSYGLIVSGIAVVSASTQTFVIATGLGTDPVKNA